MNRIDKLLISIEEMTEILAIGRSKAYELCRSPGFPVLKLGRRTLISVEGLKSWISNNVGKKLD